MAKRLQSVPLIAPPNERKDKLDKLVAEFAGNLGGGKVERSQHLKSNYLLRRPTGILSLDLGLAGGLPAGAPSVIVGPDGAGKDYMLWKVMAESQKIYGDDFTAVVYFTEFKPDKLFMKDICGLQIALSEDEIGELDQARRTYKLPGLSATELDHYRKQIGEFISIFGYTADKAFDIMFKFLQSNTAQIIAVNSIGFMQTEAKEKVEEYEDFAQQRNEAALLTKVLPQFAMYLNQHDNFDQPNETSLILVNQVRSKDAATRTMPGRPTQEKDTYKTASNSWALKHGKAIELFLHNGPKIYDDTVKPPQVVGRKKTWEITKGKLGTHEGLRGEFDFFHGIGADTVGDLVTVACSMNIIETKGAWYTYEESGFNVKTQGSARLIEYVNRDEALQAHLKERCFQEAGVAMRLR